MISPRARAACGDRFRWGSLAPMHSGPGDQGFAQPADGVGDAAIAQSVLDAVQMLDHQPRRGVRVARLHRRDHLLVLGARRGGVLAGLVEHRDQVGAHREVADHLRHDGIAEDLGDPDVKVGQQMRAKRDVVAVDRTVLALQMLLQRANLLGRRATGELADQRTLDEAPRGEHVANLFVGRLDDVPALFRPHADDSLRGELRERLPNDRPAHAEDRSEVVFGEPHPGRETLLGQRANDRERDVRGAGFAAAGRGDVVHSIATGRDVIWRVIRGPNLVSI